MIGDRVAEARRRLKIGQSELARRADLTPAAVWQIERGERTPSSDTLKKLCEALGVSSDWLLGQSDEAEFEDPELLAMFRGLSKLSPQDRETILRVYRSMKKRSRMPRSLTFAETQAVQVLEEVGVGSP